MKRCILWMRKSLLPMLLALAFSLAIASIGTASSLPTITQTNSTATVYLDPPTINGTVIGQEFTVNVNIRDAENIMSWMAGITFNATLLNCTGFFEGKFLSDVGSTYWQEGDINNTIGVIEAHGSMFLADLKASGDGRLAYATFEVIAPGVSDLHLIDAAMVDYYDPLKRISTNIIDVFTVVVDTTSHTVVTVTNSTIREEEEAPNSGLSDHTFSEPNKEVRFKVYSPYPGFSNVTIPKTLLSVEPLEEWRVIIDGSALSAEERTVTENATHTSIYFTYPSGIHDIHITARPFLSSTIKINLSSTSINVGSNVTISGYIVAADATVRGNVTVTIRYRPSDGTWATLTTRTTDMNGNYTYTWTPDAVGTYEVKASWGGDPKTEGAESDVKTLTVKGAPSIDPYIIAAAVVIIIIAAVVVYYFVKIRKPEEEEP